MRRGPIVLITVLVAISGAAVWLFRTQDLEDRLREDVRAVYGPRLRGTHVTPALDASFGELLVPVLPELKASADRFSALPSETHDLWKEVREGRQPVSALPSEFIEEIANTADAVAKTLRATHAARPDVPAGFNALHAESWAEDAPGFIGVQHAARLASLNIRLRLEGETGGNGTESTVGTCLDALALARDTSQTQGLIGSMIASAIIGILMDTCVAALDAAPADEKRRAATQLLSIRDGVKPFRDVLRDESVFAQLSLAKVALTDGELERLPAEAAAMARVHPSELSWWLKPFAALMWRRYRGVHEEWFRAMDLPRRDRTAALLRIQEEVESRSLLLDAVSSEMGKFHTRHLRVIERLELLAAASTADAIRSDNGRWPSREEVLSAAEGLSESEFSMTEEGANLKLDLPDDGYGAVSIIVTPDTQH